MDRGKPASMADVQPPVSSAEAPAKAGARVRGHLVFDPDLRRATDRISGAVVAFTRSERALLTAFMRHPGRIMSRQSLLDWTSGSGSDANDRSIDFIINRLRRKLGDTGAKRRFIATEYGEGYVWLAKAPAASDDGTYASIVIGPVYGLPAGGPLAAAGIGFLDALAGELTARVSTDQSVAVRIDGPSQVTASSPAPAFAIPVTFLPTGAGGLRPVMALKAAPSGEALSLHRPAFIIEAGAGGSYRDALGPSVTDLLRGIWQATHGTGLGAALDTFPMPIRLYAAGRVTAERNDAAHLAEARARERLAETPNDHRAAFAVASAIFSKWLMTGRSLAVAHPGLVDREMAEMEGLIQSVLPFLDPSDEAILTCGKLLWLLGPQHRTLAGDLIETGYAHTTAAASALIIMAEHRMHTSDFETAQALFDEALAMAPMGSDARGYVLTQKGKCWLASGDPAAGGQCALAAIVNQAESVAANAVSLFDITFELPGVVDADRRRRKMFAQHGRDWTRAHLWHKLRFSASVFVDPVAVANVLRQSVAWAEAHFGHNITPPDVRAALDV